LILTTRNLLLFLLYNDAFNKHNDCGNDKIKAFVIIHAEKGGKIIFYL
jgi:hypothetical protein